jgi:S-DNA-T family DNA segregation ATPase FtsK/SpoIIIE
MMRIVRFALFAAIGVAIAWVLKQLIKLTWRAVVFLVRHPRSTVATLAVLAVLDYLGWRAVVALAIVSLVATSTWRALHPESFEATLGTWARNWWRRWWTYRRTWKSTLTRCGLVIEVDDKRHVPKLKKVVTTPHWDRLAVRAQVGQEINDWRQTAERLRTAYRCERVAIREITPGLIGLDLLWRDPLKGLLVPATPMPASVALIDWRNIPVGLDEYLAPLCVSLLGGHTAVSGSTGSGKAGVEWNVLRGVAPAIAEMLVRPVGINPKAKELNQALELFAAGDYAETPEETLALLERLVDELQAANKRDARLGERDFEPSLLRPLVLILIDELAPLLAYWPRSIRSKIEDCLGILLTQGRSAGFIVLGAIQEPTKDIFPIRDLFNYRLGLRLPTEAYTDAALTDDAVDRGALCHAIPDAMPGELYKLNDGGRTALRGRLGYVQNSDIAELVTFVKTHQEVPSLDNRRAAA